MDIDNADELAPLVLDATRRGDFHLLDELVEPLDVDQLRSLVGALAAEVSYQPVDVSGPAALCDLAIAVAAPGFGTTPQAVLSKDRTRPVSDARAVAMTAARQNGLTITAIAEQFDKDHTSVIHAIRRTEADPRLEDAAARIAEQLKGRYTAALAQPSLRADAPDPQPVRADDLPVESVEHAVRATAEAFGIAVEDLLGNGRTRTLTDARAVAMSAARINGDTLSGIARHFDCHHTTVLAAVRRIDQIPPYQALAARIAEQTAPTVPTVPEPAPEPVSSYRPTGLVGDAIVASADWFGHLPEDLIGSNRSQPLADARAVAMAAARMHGETLSGISRHFYRDHSTVLSAVRRVEATPSLHKTAQRIAGELATSPATSATTQEPAPPEVTHFQPSPGARQTHRAETYTTPERATALAR